MQDENPKTATTATANPALGRSTVAKLPPDVREAVDKDMRALIQRRQEADRMVKAWMQEFGERPQGELTLVLIDSLRTMTLATMEHLAKRKEPVSMEELARLSVVLRRIESTEELRLRREQAVEKAAEAAEAAKPEPELRKGLSPETVALIDEAVLGKARWPVGGETSGPVDPLNPGESHLVPDKLAEIYPEIAPGVYRTSPTSILSLGPERPRASDAEPAARREPLVLGHGGEGQPARPKDGIVAAAAGGSSDRPAEDQR